MTGIFINYRTGDGDFVASFLDQSLVQLFGSDRVFKDSTGLEPGTDFRPKLWAKLEESTVVLVLIGERWLAEQGGVRLLDRPQDYVRREIERSLDRNVKVIPLLLAAVPLPAADLLPQSIAGLTSRQSMRLRSECIRSDFDVLVAELSKHIPPLPSSRSGGGGDRSGTVRGDGVVTVGDNSPGHYNRCEGQL